MTHDILIIALLCCIWVQSGAAESFKNLVWRVLGGKEKPSHQKPLKPFDCELCLTWWCGVAYLLITSSFTLNGLLLVSIVAWSTPILTDLLNLAVEIPRWALSKVIERLK